MEEGAALPGNGVILDPAAEPEGTPARMLLINSACNLFGLTVVELEVWLSTLGVISAGRLGVDEVPALNGDEVSTNLLRLMFCSNPLEIRDPASLEGVGEEAIIGAAVNDLV